MSYKYCFKSILVGNSNSGKTSLLNTLINNNFDFEHQPTIGVGFNMKIFNLKNNNSVKLQIWDTAGLERFNSITRAYFKKSTIVFIVYDVSDRESFEDVKSWYNMIKSECHNKTFITLIGNKNDILKRQVSYQEGKDLANLLNKNILFFETSAVSDKDIDKIFVNSINKVIKEIDELSEIEKNEIGIKEIKDNLLTIEDEGICCSIM